MLMFCANCGESNPADARVCAACGMTMQVAELPNTVPATAPFTPPTPARPSIVTALAIVQFIWVGFWTLGFVYCAGLLAAGHVPDVVRWIVVVLTALCGGLGVLQLVCGIGLWKLKSYGRTIQLVLSAIGLIGFPIGTVISVLILVYLNRPGVRLMFSNRPAADLTTEETQQVVEAIQGGTAGTALAVGLVAFTAIIVVGIVGAIAVPGLLRARISGNEATAIASLRAIGSAEEHYFQRCRGYAPDLTELTRLGDLSSDFAGESHVTRRGYTIAVVSGGAAIPPQTLPSNCRGSVTDFFSHADPVRPGRTGRRYFAGDSRQIIFMNAAPMHYPPRGVPLR
jgi:type II secretory pathway pseudopilin PulG